MEEKEIHDELASIRNLMERSSKFISLSGLSGILAGVYALIGAAAAYLYIYETAAEYEQISGSATHLKTIFYGGSSGFFYFGISDHFIVLLLIALSVLIASLGTGFFLTVRKANRKGQPVWGSASRSLLFSMAAPLFAGGILILLMVERGYYEVAAPFSLIFYGLSLVSASNFTFTMVKYLGLCEIALGLIAACLPGYGLLFWAIGFGVLHIVYGSMMYLKYDR